jgi:hypothetical protein
MIALESIATERGKALPVSVSLPFRSLFHADWSTVAKKRWVAHAARTDEGWQAMLPYPVGDTRDFVDALFAAAGPVLAGFDFPIGVPASFGQLTGLTNFSTAVSIPRQSPGALGCEPLEAAIWGR